jgi:outer membrane lipoprotein-sorting protein
MENSIQDVQVEFERSIHPPISQNELKGKRLAAQKGPAKYKWATTRPFDERSLSTQEVTLFDESGKTWNSIIRQSYNGKIAKYLSISPDRRPARSEGTITKSKRFILHVTATPQNFTIMRYMQEPYNYPLSRAIRQKEWVNVGDSIEKINGFNTICATFFMQGIIRADGKKTRVMDVYFSVDHGYTPIKFADISHDKPISSVEIIELQQVSQGLWYPKYGRMVWPDSQSIEDRTLIYKATSIKVNQGLSDDHFDIEFPAGTTIIDEILNKTYVIKP